MLNAFFPENNAFMRKCGKA